MNGFHFTLLGGIALIVVTFWLLKYSSNALTIGPGVARQAGKVAYTFQNPGGKG